jgi:hypothetical protein
MKMVYAAVCYFNLCCAVFVIWSALLNELLSAGTGRLPRYWGGALVVCSMHPQKLLSKPGSGHGRLGLACKAQLLYLSFAGPWQWSDCCSQSPVVVQTPDRTVPYGTVWYRSFCSYDYF